MRSCLLKNDYRSVIVITFICHIVCYVMAISTFSKDEADVENGDEFFCRYYWYIKIGCWAALGAISKGKILGGKKQ